MLKSVESDEQQIRIFEMAKSQSRIVLLILFNYLFLFLTKPFIVLPQSSQI